jgi:hypothetical protein
LETHEEVMNPTAMVTRRQQFLNMEFIMAMAETFKKMDDHKKGFGHFCESS